MTEEMSDSNSTISVKTMENSVGIVIDSDPSVESENFIGVENNEENIGSITLEKQNEEMQQKSNSGDVTDGRKKNVNNYAANKNIAEGLMDIALLSANANQLRFLLQYKQSVPSYYISLGLVITSLCLQILVGVMLIFKRSMGRWNHPKRFIRFNEILVGSVFVVTVVNVLLAAFTTTSEEKNI